MCCKMRDIFNQRKKDILSKKDKSSRQDVDEKIKLLCNKINSFENFYTTSSCSGRIYLIKDQEKKGKGLFLFMNHDLIDFEKFKKNLNKCPGVVMRFKQEPCFVVVMCRGQSDAIWLINLAKHNGFDKCSINSISNYGYCVELMAGARIEFPLSKSDFIANEIFFEKILKRANSNLEDCWKKIEKLKNSLKK